ncbi:glycosyltransferase 87 family protein [Streptomyces sp. RKND-216]|uniref:glycosyltransferase 87 family protein n=1 Tax=Streptomyces sp. RKND-216 TaxID=2562581 RepID=UPI001FFBDE78|nr:glycosyltransferase 87 family protein [Streptomyces sp. RKND-216]
MYPLRRPLLASGLLCLGSFALFWTAQRAADVSLIDVMVYRAQGEAVLRGEDLYALRATHADLPATYPPFAALLFVPLALLEADTLRAVATAANLLLLVLVVHLSLRLAGRPQSEPTAAAALAVSALAVWCEPVWTTLRYGQVNLLLAALVLWDLSRRSGHRWAGIGIGVAAGVKLTPALFVVLLALAGVVEAWRRQGWTGLRGPVRAGGPAAVRTALAGAWNAHLRQAAVATGAFLGTAGLAATVLPGDSLRFWTEILFRADRVGNAEDTANQSLHGVLARALHTGDPGAAATALSMAVAVAGLGVAVAALLAGSRLPRSTAWAGTACALTALLISPVSWSHHWVWCVPAVVLLGAEALHRRDDRWWWGTAACAAVFCTYALWWVPHSPDRAERLELRQGAGEMLLSAVYPLAGAAFLALAAAVAVRAAGRTGPYAGARVVRARSELQAVAKE